MPGRSPLRRYEFHPEAEKDFLEALRFYRERESNEVAKSLQAEVERSAELLLRHPEIAPVIGDKHVRRLVLDRFPFNPHYVIARDVVRILAVAHQSRDPGYWSRRR